MNRILLLLVPAFAAIALALPAHAVQDTAPTRTVKDSVFTAAQAEQGKALFGTVCSECHAESEFTDRSFITSWSTATVFEFFDNLRASMPESAPASLLDEEYASAVSFILSLNRFPAGGKPLTPVEDSLKAIMMALPDTVRAPARADRPVRRPASYLHPVRR
jgi:mono/diheme cytochrome c family protein